MAITKDTTGGVCGRNHEQSRENKLRTVTGNERTKWLSGGFSWELRPMPTEILEARNSVREQQDIKVQIPLKIRFTYETR